MSHDRVRSDSFALTQEFLSPMRAKVTVVAGMLQKAGLICYGRGQITILNRLDLEKVSCKCCVLVKSEFDCWG